MTRFMRLLVVVCACWVEPIEDCNKSSIEILFFSAWYSSFCRLVSWQYIRISIWKSIKDIYILKTRKKIQYQHKVENTCKPDYGIRDNIHISRNTVSLYKHVIWLVIQKNILSLTLFPVTHSIFCPWEISSISKKHQLLSTAVTCKNIFPNIPGPVFSTTNYNSTTQRVRRKKNLFHNLLNWLPALPFT